jgi:general stress protein YciG
VAAEAGRRGGESVPAEERSFSQDRQMAAEAGRKGGESRSGQQQGENNGGKQQDGGSDNRGRQRR